MARNTCYGYDWDNGQCINYGDTNIYPGVFHPTAGTHPGGYGDPGDVNLPNSGNQNAPGGPTTGFPGAAQVNPFAGSQNAALGGAALDERAIFWLAVIGVVLLVK